MAPKLNCRQPNESRLGTEHLRLPDESLKAYVYAFLYSTCDVLNLSRWVHSDCRQASDSFVNGTRRRRPAGRGLFRSAARVSIGSHDAGLEPSIRPRHRGGGIPYL